VSVQTPSASPRSSFGNWVEGARPRTLPAAIVPVLVGTAAVRPLSIAYDRVLLATVIALSLQIGTNFANDYSDGIRGSDDVRVGPVRLVGQKLASPAAVRLAALISFGVAVIAGLVVCALSSWWLLIPGAAAVIAGWFYTGGPKPYGYLGLGELFVLVFFGFVATVGSTFVQHKTMPMVSWIAAVAVGLLATALLEANNLRDIEGDRHSNKRTLAVRLGRARAGWLFVMSYLGAGLAIVVCGLWRPWALLGLIGLLAAIPSCRLALSDHEGRALLPMLKSSGRTQLLVGVLLTLGLALG
jgi:1,4-dihydroxy-2-naphthoate polyprenyltransferase